MRAKARQRVKDVGLVLLREIAFYTHHQPMLFYQYAYMFTPAQLCFLCSCLDATNDVPGSILEIGCAYGYTTVFMNKHLSTSGIEKPYVCVDTFSGFTQADVNYERTRPGKGELLDAFRTNKKRWFQRTLEINEVRAQAFEADAATFDYDSVAPISFCLIDVDLYQPVKGTLKAIFDLIAPGGLIVVDDCAEDQPFDGAYQAYREFIEAEAIKSRVVLGKLGMIEKPREQPKTPAGAILMQEESHS